MQLSVMRTESRLIFGQPDSANSDISEAQLNLWANEAYRKACIRLRTKPIKERDYSTPASGAEITLNAGTINVDLAKIKIQPENKWVPLEVMDLVDLMLIDPDWENATTGKPTRLVRKGTFTAILHPPPNASNLSQTNAITTYGLEIPTALSSDADLPDLPADVHDYFPNYMAHRAFLRLRDKESSVEQLVLWNQGLKDHLGFVGNFSKSKGFTWHEADPGARDWPS